MMTGIGTPSSHKRIPRPMTSLLQLMVEAIKSRPGKSFRRGMDEGALNAARGRRRPNRQHLGVRGRIAVAQRAVAPACEHRAVAHDHAADRHLAGFARRTRLGERVIHERLWHNPPPWRRIKIHKASASPK